MLLELSSLYHYHIRMCFFSWRYCVDFWKNDVRVHILLLGVWSWNFQELKTSWVLQNCKVSASNSHWKYANSHIIFFEPCRLKKTLLYRWYPERNEKHVGLVSMLDFWYRDFQISRFSRFSSPRPPKSSKSMILKSRDLDIKIYRNLIEDFI